ncbi:helix-turn-helix transcriptional regulator [Janibacter sp. GXQ6167]|uniref:helix-turn-helix transcriptional regulator n=1 Tax=Janibacter sp. GXQ6167 TaxID=3240791 RepID=UPI00352672D7
MTRTPPESATARMQRLLTMVPWLVRRQGISLPEAARGLGIDEAQLKKDLDLLLLVGHGTMPDEMIETSYEHGKVSIANAETIERPLRLGLDEAITLIVGLRALAATPGLDSPAIDSALAKLDAATAGLAGVERVVVAPDGSVDGEVLAALRDAVTRSRRVHLTYLVSSRDERTERDVDPMRVVAYDGHWYLEGWCHRAQDVRLFRTDRIEEVEVLDVPGTPPAEAVARDLSAGLYQGSDQDVHAVVRLAPGARWVADYYPVTDSREEGDDLVVTLPASDLDWLARLIVGLGDQAQILAPPEAIAAVAERAQAALSLYQSEQPG